MAKAEDTSSIPPRVGPTNCVTQDASKTEAMNKAFCPKKAKERFNTENPFVRPICNATQVLLKGSAIQCHDGYSTMAFHKEYIARIEYEGKGLALSMLKKAGL